MIKYTKDGSNRHDNIDVIFSNYVSSIIYNPVAHVMNLSMS